MSTHNFAQRTSRPTGKTRRGSILPLAAACMTMTLGFVAFTVDIGYIALTKTQLQNASDAAAIAAGSQLIEGLGIGAPLTSSQVASNGRATAVAVAAANRAGDRNSVYISATNDVQFGQRMWNAGTASWQENWGVAPYNMVRVTAHRDQVPSGSTPPPGNQPLPLFFATVLGTGSAQLEVSATAALLPAVGYRLLSNSAATSPILPIAFDLPSWNALLAGTGSDNYSYNAVTGAVTSGPDGIKEIDLYPYGNQALTPGNRGTVNLGPPNNSTAILNRQIQYGLNASDLAYFNGFVRTDQGALLLKGNPGLSAGIKSSLTAIIGQPRVLPIFTSVTGQGNNTTYTVSQMVGIRILNVNLTGGSKSVVAQPAIVVDSSLFSGTSTSTNQNIYAPLQIVD